MKVGTDSILLGTWVGTGRVVRALDVGSGCGVIALILAQRTSAAMIDAVEIDRAAAGQAMENFSRSPWSDRLKIVAGPFQDFCAFRQTGDLPYDLIVSNPPWFSAATPARNEARNVARHDHRLTLKEILVASRGLMHSHSRIGLVLPFGSAEICCELARDVDLHLARRTAVRSFSDRSPTRVLLEFSAAALSEEGSFGSLSIYAAPGKYSEEFWALTSSCYLARTPANPLQ